MYASVHVRFRSIKFQIRDQFSPKKSTTTTTQSSPVGCLFLFPSVAFFFYFFDKSKRDILIFLFFSFLCVCLCWLRYGNKRRRHAISLSFFVVCKCSTLTSQRWRIVSSVRRKNVDHKRRAAPESSENMGKNRTTTCRCLSLL